MAPDILALRFIFYLVTFHEGRPKREGIDQPRTGRGFIDKCERPQNALFYDVSAGYHRNRFEMNAW